MHSVSTTTTKSTSSTTSRKINETSDLSLSEQSSFTTSPQTERKITESKANPNSNASQSYHRNSGSTKSGTLSSNYSTNPSSQNSSVGFVWKPNSSRIENSRPMDTQSPADSHSTSSDKNDKYGSEKSSYPNANTDIQQNQAHNKPQEQQQQKQSNQHSHVNQLVNNFNKMFPQVTSDKLESKSSSSHPSQRLNDNQYPKKEGNPFLSDNSTKGGLEPAASQRLPNNGLNESWSNSMQRSNGRFKDDDDTYYDTKYGKFGSLGRKESMGRYRKYQPTKSSSGVITFGSPRLMQRSVALKSTENQNSNQSENLFTDTGSPKYVNTAAILGQQPHKQRSQQQPYNKDPLSQTHINSSPVIGRRGMQQSGSQRDDYAKQISKNLSNDFLKYGIEANTNRQNNRLHPVTTIQQVLYCNGSQTGNGSAGAPTPHLSNGYDQGPSPKQPPPTIAQIPNFDNDMPRAEALHNNQRIYPGGGGHKLGNTSQAVNHNSSSSSTTSSNFIPSLQNSCESSNIPQNSGGDRIILERNLEKLITQKGLEVLGQLTAEMTHDQIERLLHKTKEKLGTNSVNQSIESPSDFGNFESSAASRSRRPLDIDFTRNNDLDGYLAQQLQVAPAPTNGMPHVANSHKRYGSQASCPSWAQEGDSFHSTPSGSKTKSPDLNNLKFIPHQEMNGRIGEDSSSNEEDNGHGVKPRKGNLVNNNYPYQGNHNPNHKKHHNKHRADRLNASFHGEGMGVKNLSVRFDAGQEHNMANQPGHLPSYPDYPSSPYVEQRSRHLPPQGYPHHQRSHSTNHHHHHHRHHREHKPFHQRSASSSRQPQSGSTQHLQQQYKEDYHDGPSSQPNYNHQPISRSHSYSSGQAGFANAIDPHRGGGHHHPQQHGHNRNQSPSMLMPSAMRGQTPNTKRKHGRNVAFYDDEDGRCPTCSSDSSSDSDDDPYAYQPAPRKAYGGVRLSYVPNDRRRAKLMSDPRLEYVPRNLHAGNKQPQMNHAARAGSLQPQSLPPVNRHQNHQQQYHQSQANGGIFLQQPNNVQQNHHKQQHPHQNHQQAPYFPSQPGHHRNTQNGQPSQHRHPQNISPAQSGGGDPKDKDKNCVIQ